MFSEHDRLKTLDRMAKFGASEDNIGYVLAAAAGERMIAFREVGGGTVHVKVGRVAAFMSIAGGYTRLYFTNPPLRKRTVDVDMSAVDVHRCLVAAGWTEPT